MNVYVLKPGSTALGLECPFCGSPLEKEDRAVACPECKAYHHAECWRFGGQKCARLGCGGRETIDTGRLSTDSLIPDVMQSPRQTLRLSVSDVTQAMRSMPRRTAGAGSTFPGARTTALGILIVHIVFGLLLGLLYRALFLGLPWAIGDERFQAIFAVNWLSRLADIPLWWWVPGSAVFGLMHHLFLQGKLRGLYPLLRMLAIVTLCGALGYLLGFAMFFPSYRWPSLVWGLLEKVRWLSYVAAGGMVLLMVFSAIGSYQSRFTVFDMAFGAVIIAGFALINGYLNALIYGLILGALGLLVGAGIGLIWHNGELGGLLSGYGLLLGGSYGILVGWFRTLKTFNSYTAR